MNFRPLSDRVLIKRAEAASSTKGGILLPEAAQDKPLEGEIVAVGPGAKNDAGVVVPLEVSVGDRVLFGKWAGTDIKTPEGTLVVVQETDILGVLG